MYPFCNYCGWASSGGDNPFYRCSSWTAPGGTVHSIPVPRGCPGGIHTFYICCTWAVPGGDHIIYPCYSWAGPCGTTILSLLHLSCFMWAHTFYPAPHGPLWVRTRHSITAPRGLFNVVSTYSIPASCGFFLMGTRNSIPDPRGLFQVESHNYHCPLCVVSGGTTHSITTPHGLSSWGPYILFLFHVGSSRWGPDILFLLHVELSRWGPYNYPRSKWAVPGGITHSITSPCGLFQEGSIHSIPAPCGFSQVDQTFYSCSTYAALVGDHKFYSCST